ncbi:MAG: ABC transporter substrate-binding protein [Dehalococcoidia bacterium]
MHDRGTTAQSRRSMLRASTRLLVGLGGLSLLVACGGTANAPAATVVAAAPTSAASSATKPATTTTAVPASAPTTAAVQVATPLPPPAGQKAIALRMHVRAGVEDQMLDKQLPLFQQANPGVSVTQEPFPGGEYFQKLQTLAAGGNLGDVVHLFTGDMSYQQFFTSGIFVPIDDYIAKEKFDLGQYYKYSVDGAYVDGKIGGLPFKSHPSRCGLFYNEDLFTQAGIQPPSLDMSIDDLVAATKKLTKPGDVSTAVYGYGWNWHDLEYYVCVARNYGSELFSKDGKTWAGSSPEALKGWQWHYDMLNTYKVAINPLQTSPSNNDLFLSGKLAMYRVNIGTKAAYTAVTKFKWNMTLPPKGPTGSRGTFAETDMMSITKFTKAKDQAWALLKWVTSKDAGIGLASQTGNRSSTAGGRPDVYNSPEFLNLPGYPPGVQKTTLLAMEQAEPYLAPANFRGPELQRAIDPIMDLIILGKSQADKAWADKLTQAAQDIMDKPRA